MSALFRFLDASPRLCTTCLLLCFLAVAAMEVPQ